MTTANIAGHTAAMVGSKRLADKAVHAMRGDLNRKETSVTLENVDSAFVFLVILDPGALISRGSNTSSLDRSS